MTKTKLTGIVFWLTRDGRKRCPTAGLILAKESNGPYLVVVNYSKDNKVEYRVQEEAVIEIIGETPKLEIYGIDNAFGILAEARRAAFDAGWSAKRIEGFIKEAKSKDYDHLLATCKMYFNMT